MLSDVSTSNIEGHEFCKVLEGTDILSKFYEAFLFRRKSPRFGIFLQQCSILNKMVCFIIIQESFQKIYQYVNHVFHKHYFSIISTSSASWVKFLW